MSETRQAESESFRAVLDAYIRAVKSGDESMLAELPVLHPELVQFIEQLRSLDRKEPATGLADTIMFQRAVAARQAADGPTSPVEATFGKYQLLEEAGRGGMGVVYKAHQTDLGRTVALKMILSSRLASHDDVQRFDREARAAGSLRHPNIVGIHEVGEVNGQHYFTMDYIDGESLAVRLRREPIAIDVAVGIVVAVARAVEYLHQHGIVHRDLKPANVLLDELNQPFVTDFGLAKIFETDDLRTETGLILGTASYMSPEQASGNVRAITPRSDVYSLGTILYELLTGRPAFKEDNQLNTVLQVLEGEPTMPTQLNPRLPRELERVTLKCMAKDPAQRYTSAAALADDLDRFRRGEPVEASAASVWQRLRRWIRRQPALASHLAALLPVMLILHVKFMLSGYLWPQYYNVMPLFASWAIAEFACQWLLNRPATAVLGRFAWAVADVGFMTAVLFMAENAPGPLLIGYPLIVVAAGLWFDERLVAITTVLVIASYIGLAASRAGEMGPLHYSFIFVACMAIVGFTVGYQVRRLRALNRYFEQQRML